MGTLDRAPERPGCFVRSSLQRPRGVKGPSLFKASGASVALEAAETSEVSASLFCAAPTWDNLLLTSGG